MERHDGVAAAFRAGGGAVACKQGAVERGTRKLRACVRACVRACLRACVRACVHAWNKHQVDENVGQRWLICVNTDLMQPSIIIMVSVIFWSKVSYVVTC